MTESLETSRMRWGVLAASSLLFALLPVVFFAVYVEYLGGPRTALAAHAQVVGLVWLALFAVRAAIHAMPLSRPWRDGLSALGIALVVAGTLIYYSLVVIGLVYWGRVISVGLLTTYVRQASDLLAALEISLVVGALAAATVFLGVWGIALAYIRRFDWIAPLLQRRSPLFIALLAVPLGSIAAIRAVELEHTGWARLGEPVSLTFYPEQAETGRVAELDRLEDAIAAAYRPNPAAKRPNVILIVVDALRADHMSVLGYDRPTTPHLERLKRAGNVAVTSSAYSVCTESICGLLGIASSRYAGEFPARPMGLPTVLRRHGYRVHMLLSGDHTNFYGLRGAYDRVDSYYDGVSQRARYANDDRVIVDRMRGISPWDGKPIMFQFHLMSAHLLGKRFDDTPSFGPTENYAKIPFLRDNDPRTRERAVNFYDRGVVQADRVIHEILELLRERGYLHDALVVITGDHGEALGEHGLYSHTTGVLDVQLRVPLLILTFGQVGVAPAPASALLSQIDIAPTVADALDMPIPDSWIGRPLRLVESAREIYFSQVHWEGLIQRSTDGVTYKYWIDRRDGHEFAYDLSSDPAEFRNVAATLPLSVKMGWVNVLNVRRGRDAPTRRVGLMEHPTEGPIVSRKD